MDEFAIGFPPRILSKKIGETRYAINLVPFGGYVKIFGEDAGDVEEGSAQSSRSLTTKNRAIQALVLAGGILANIVFAWVLLSLVFMTGTPASTGEHVGTHLENEHLLVVGVLPDSPADKALIKAGDTIVSLTAGVKQLTAPTVESVQQFISNENGDM